MKTDKKWLIILKKAYFVDKNTKINLKSIEINKKRRTIQIIHTFLKWKKVIKEQFFPKNQTL